MGKTRRKTTIAFVVMLTMAVTLVALPAAAQEPPKKKTYAYLGAVPNPVGRGQPVLLHVGITDYLRTVADGWEGLSVTIEKPDGTTETIEDIRTDSTGGTGKTYTPDQTGTYYLQTHFPEQEYRNILYEASESDKLALVVQEEPIEYYPGQLLPSEYWTRPIDSQLREWCNISGNWLTTPDNLFAPYNDGPESAHILWTKPLTIGGLAGGELGPQGFGCGDAYEGKWPGPIIIAGRLYYWEGGSRGLEPVVYHCVDLHTGEELWSKTFLDNRTIAFGQLFYWDSYNYHGVFPYLWVMTGGFDWATWTFLPEAWHAFDAFTGDWRYSITNVPSGTTLRGPNGEIYKLQVDLEDGWMALWDSSALISVEGSWGNVAHGRTFNATAIDPETGELTTAAKRAWIWNKTIPTGLPGRIQTAFFEDRVIGASTTQTEIKMWGLDLRPGYEGEKLFDNTWKAPAEWTEGNVTIGGFGGGWMAWSAEDKVGVLWVKETREHYGFSLEDGKKLWGPTEPQYYLDAIEDTPQNARAIAYGKLYSASASGIVYCYDVKTGDLLWTYEVSDPYQEILWANNWSPLRLVFITDGKIYIGHGEHSAIDPKPRGAPFFCLNATTGEEIFRIDGAFRSTRWGGRAIIGDSIIATQDTYDQRVYAIGKGPSATEVSASPKIVANGDSVLIEGRVTDQSPGAKDTPAIADEFMSEWMLYLYKQFPAPMNIHGVDVRLQAMSSDGTITEIGWVKADGAGCFSYKWTPPDEDTYRIMAIFEGSKSYYASYAQTGLGVGAEPLELATPEGVQEDIDNLVSSLTPILYGTIVAVAVAIVIGIVNLFAIRKQRK